MDILPGSGPLGSGPTGPGSGFSVMPKIAGLDYDVFLSANVETMIFPSLVKARTIISSFRRFFVDFLAAFN